MEAAAFSLSAVDHGLDDSAIASISFMLSALPLRPSASTARICQVVKSRLFVICGGAFCHQIVKVRALSAPTQEILLKYSLDLPYIQT